MKKLQNKLRNRQNASHQSSNPALAASNGARDTSSDFVPFVQERSSMGRLLSLEDTRPKDSEKKRRRFELSTQQIAYLDTEFKDRQQSTIEEAGVNIMRN